MLLMNFREIAEDHVDIQEIQVVWDRRRLLAGGGAGDFNIWEESLQGNVEKLEDQGEEGKKRNE